MQIRSSRRLQSLTGYPFAEVDRMVAQLRADGRNPIDFGVGDPTEPTPDFIREAIKEAVDRRASEGYPSYIGAAEYRRAIADWFQRRFGVKLDADTEVCANIGAKEAVFNFPHAIIDPGDVVLCPSPGYPPYNRGTMFAGGTPWYYPISWDNDFLPDLEGIPEEVLDRTRLIWVNFPNSPSGRTAPDDFWPRLLNWAKKNEIIVASDEAYTEVWFDKPPRSALEFSKDGVVVIQSLSKRSNMTGHRVGYVCGDARIVSLFKKLKTNIDSGTATYVQDGAIAALADEKHVEEMRALYKAKREILIPALEAVGCEVPDTSATLYLWPRVPKGLNGLEFAKKLLAPKVAVVCTPGPALGEPLADGTNPGERHVRFALVPSVEQCKEAAARMKKAF